MSQRLTSANGSYDQRSSKEIITNSSCLLQFFVVVAVAVVVVVVGGVGWGVCGLGWALTRGWALIKFSFQRDGCLFEVVVNLIK